MQGRPLQKIAVKLPAEAKGFAASILGGGAIGGLFRWDSNPAAGMFVGGILGLAIFIIVGNYRNSKPEGDRLAFWGAIISLIASGIIAVYVAEDTQKLNARIKQTEIVMALANQLAGCRQLVASVNNSNEGLQDFFQEKDNLVRCRSALTASLAGLRVLQDGFQFPDVKRTYSDLKILDTRIKGTIAKTQSAIFGQLTEDEKMN